MEGLAWCRKQKKGIKLAEPNPGISKGYLKMAQDSIGTMNRERDKNLVFSVSAGYYCIYYSIYSLLQKIGVKCEIHSCSIIFAKKFLDKLYSEADFKLVDIAFSLRNNFQYYVGRNFNKKDLKFMFDNVYKFYVKSREMCAKLDEAEIKEIRRKFRNEN